MKLRTYLRLQRRQDSYQLGTSVRNGYWQMHHAHSTSIYKFLSLSHNQYHITGISVHQISCMLMHASRGYGVWIVHSMACMKSAVLAALLVGSFIMAARYEDRGIDKYMINFEPHRGNKNPNHDYDSQTLIYLKGGTVYDLRRRDEFCGRIKRWLSEYLQSVIKEVGNASSIVLLTVPGHEKDSQPKEFMCGALRKVLQEHKFADVKSGHLRRKETVRKSTEGGPRYESTHRNSIEVVDSELVKGKTVIIIDDVWTSGSTLRACASLVKDAGASDTKMIAVGKTVPKTG